MNCVRPHVMHIFPGQGSQYVGMGSDIYREFETARRVYERAGDSVGFDIAKLSFHGPQEQLSRTEFTQLALLTHSMACLEVYKELSANRWPAAVVAGHSLGEYSALVAAGALTFEDALTLVQQRGRLMSKYGRGRMAAFALDLDSLKSIAESHYCGIGGCNLPEQTVVCGLEDDLDALIEEVVKSYGKAKTGRYLNTKGAFHTYLMINAAEHFREYLEPITVHEPKVKVLSNYTGDYHSTDPAKIKASLFFQIFHPVKWMWGLQRAIADGVNTILEFGGGIGKDKSGEAQLPSSRKPNLEGITRKSQRAAGRDGLYLPAINSGSLRQAAQALHLLHQQVEDTQDAGLLDNFAIDQKWFRLFVPMRDGVISQKALELTMLVEDMGLDTFVQTVGEPYEKSIQLLQYCCDTEIADAEPYLEVVAGGTTAALLHYRRDEIIRELRDLQQTLQRRGHEFHAHV